MPSLKDATTPPANLKNMVQVPTPSVFTTPPPPIPQPDIYNPYAVGPTPSIFTTDYDRALQFRRAGTSQFRIPPLPLKSNPQHAAIARSAATQGSTGAADASNELTFRGTWLSFVNYAINDVVIFDGSTYIAILGNSGLRPDQNTADWTLLSENLVFNPNLGPVPTLTQLDVSTATTGTGKTILATVQPSAAGEFAILSVNLETQPSSITDTVGNPLDGTWSAPLGAQADWSKLYNSSALLSESQTISASAGTDYWVANIALFGTTGTPSVVNTYSFGSNNNPGPGLTRNIPSAFTPTGGNTLYCVMTITNATNGAFAGHPDNFSISDSAGNTWVVIGQPANLGSSGGSGGTGDFAQLFLAYAANVKGVSTQVTITQSASDNNPTGYNGVGGQILEITNLGPAAKVVFEPYDVVEFRGSMFVCLKETSSDAFADPTKWALIGPGSGSVNILTANYPAVAADTGRLLSFNSSSAVTLTLPNPVPAPPAGATETAWWIAVQNIGTGTLTIANNTLKIDGVAGNLTLGQNQGLIIFADATGNYETLHGMTSIVLPNIFVNSGVNGAGLVTITLASQSANLVWASPDGSSGTPLFRKVVEADISLSDNTTDNVSTARHGFAPKSPNDITKFLDGTGAYSVPTVAVTQAPGDNSTKIATDAFVAAAIANTILSDAQAIGTLITTSKSGTLRINGAVPPAGVYRVSVNFLLQANPAAGSLDVNIGWNDGTSARNATNGTLGAPADISTVALNLADGTIVLVSDGVHDITWAMTLT